MTRFTVRQLPLPAKLVISTFLLAVGVGYTSAMVQLHMQHGERDGEHLPTVANVVAVFAGKVWKTDGDPVPTSRLEAIISGDKDGAFNGNNMAPAFFAHDESDYKKQARDPARKPLLDAERDGERRAVLAWAGVAPATRQRAYEENDFALPPDRAKAPISPAYADKTKPGAVKIAQLLKDRCEWCHKPGGDKGDVPLTTYEELARYMSATAVVPPGGGWVDSGRGVSLEKLTQSTHAHLLSFAMLFALTGLVFAFTGYYGWVRGVVGPGVLVAQFADVACWWLARLPDAGPYFAMCIVGTGGAVGVGLMVQIVGGLWDLYGPKGKAVLVGLFLVAGGVGTLAYVNVVGPHLADERAAKAARAAADARKRADDAKPKAEERPAVGQPGPAGPSRLERLLTGEYAPKGPFNGKAAGGMVRAFFNKDETFDEAEIDERKSEQALVLAWLRSDPGARKAAYDADRFPPPADLAGKPFGAQFRADAAGIKVKSLFDARCATCHKPGGDKEEFPLDTYEAIEKYLKPEPAAAGDGPIPPAKE